MKQYIILSATFILCVLFLSSELSAQKGKWEKVDEIVPYTYASFRDIKCYDSLNCMTWMSLQGAGGFIIRRTTDGGESWKNVYMDSAYINYEDGIFDYHLVPDMEYMAYPSENLFIIVGDSGVVLRTTDKGETWDKRVVDANSRISKIFMYNDKHGIHNLYNHNGQPSDTSYYYETTDGGETWNKITTDLIGKISLSDAVYVNENMIYGWGGYRTDPPHNVFMKISNDWHNLDTLPITYGGSNLHFLDENVGWAAGGKSDWHVYYNTTQTIYFTSDGGNSWNMQRDQKFNAFTLHDIEFYDQNFGMATSSLSLVLFTTDGGQHWREDSVVYPYDDGNFYYIGAVEIPSATTAFINFDNWYIYKYTRELEPIEIATPTITAIATNDTIYITRDTTLIGGNLTVKEGVIGEVNWTECEGIDTYEIQIADGFYFDKVGVLVTRLQANTWQPVRFPDLEPNRSYWLRIRARNFSSINTIGEWSEKRRFFLVERGSFTSAPENEENQFSVNVYPNPAENLLNIRFTLPGAQQTNIMLSDILGSKKEILYSGIADAGISTMTFPINELPSGVYYIIFNAGSLSQVKKITILK